MQTFSIKQEVFQIEMSDGCLGVLGARDYEREQLG
jgi:hypothetical protein